MTIYAVLAIVSTSLTEKVSTAAFITSNKLDADSKLSGLKSAFPGGSFWIEEHYL